jgi:penicillin-binding protein 1A
MTGGVVAAPVWAKFMKNALKNNDKKDFLQPDKVINISVCKESGLLPINSCPETLTVSFIKGTEPTSYCIIHQTIFEKPKPEEYQEIKKPYEEYQEIKKPYEEYQEIKMPYEEYQEIKKPYYEEIETLKKKQEEKPIETKEEEETLQSLIDKLREKYKKPNE